VQEFYFWYVYNQDKEYAAISSDIVKYLRMYPGIKQTDFYKKTLRIKNDIGFALYFLEKEEKVVQGTRGTHLSSLFARRNH
jgi:hypothetical protein